MSNQGPGLYQQRQSIQSKGGECAAPLFGLVCLRHGLWNQLV